MVWSLMKHIELPSRKRAKPNGDGGPSESINLGDHSEKVLSEMIGVSTNITQQREERHKKEAEVRESEKRKNNIWDAIKEIPDLEKRHSYLEHERCLS
ncbi:unnamed protein product [Eruca vesicaria subsp. sativa]|uniref:Uncharacterized protein n=1 Tax=Eruca vesicaria subsp. sativa TaxID=29727 RepID=A0ABC8LQT0_ERUVS|nr:unnamed protein product [Eruca vesicaria subsp. sativa]